MVAASSSADGPLSLWLSRPSPPEEVDVAVVGGGIAGLSTAYWLARMGRKPVLLEAGAIAGRASGRNAGFLISGTAWPFTVLAGRIGEAATRRFWEVSTESRDLLRGELLDPGKIDCDFLPEGSWIAAMTERPQQEAALRESAELLAGMGFDLEWREAAEVRRASGSGLLGGAIFQPRDGGLHSVRLCRGIARLIREAGGEVRTGWRVHAMEPEGNRIRLVSEAGLLSAERVVLAMNAYAPALLPHLAGEVRPVRGQIFATEPGQPRELSGVWYVNDGFEYIRQLLDGTVLLGGARWTALETEVGYDEIPTGKVQGALEMFLRDVFPRFADLPIRHRWAGTMAFTSDGLPRTGQVPGLPGAFYVAGFNGHGMSLGFATGRWLARRTLGEETGELFSPGTRDGRPDSPSVL